MRAGNLDTKASFYAKVFTRDEYNSTVETWPALTLTAWGELQYAGGDAILSNEEKFWSGTVFLKTRYRSEIIETMRVLISVEWYRITYIEILGRREGLKITLKKINE